MCQYKLTVFVFELVQIIEECLYIESGRVNNGENGEWEGGAGRGGEGERLLICPSNTEKHFQIARKI